MISFLLSRLRESSFQNTAKALKKKSLGRASFQHLGPSINAKALYLSAVLTWPLYSTTE